MTREEALRLVQQDDNLRRFLNVLSITEGSNNASNPYLSQGGTTGGMLSTGYQAHPRAMGQGVWQFKDKRGQMLKSTANGKYMITYPTWQGIEKRWGKMDFSPQSQDAAAVYLINEQGALDDVRQGNWNAALPKLGKIWASLPTAPDSYNQFRHTWDGVKQAFAQAGLQYEPGQRGNAPAAVMQQTRPSVGSVGMSVGGVAQDVSKNDFLQKMMQAPQPPRPQYTPSSANPEEYQTIQWLTKPTGMYGW